MSLENTKAAAVMEFVDLMIGAFESGFVNENTLNLAQLHRIAENHVKDSFNVTYAGIVERHGRELAVECGAKFAEVKACNTQDQTGQ